jgi:anti-anti-sigma factor
MLKNAPSTRSSSTLCVTATAEAAGRAPGLDVMAYHRGDRMRVVVIGELDIESDHGLHRALSSLLRHSRTGIDLDLSKVGFCDCSGLNTLLRIRRLALREGKTVTSCAASGAVVRLLTLTRTLPLFTAPADDLDQELRTELVRIQQSLRTGPVVIELARDMLSASFALAPEEAWSTLVGISQRTDTPLHRLAEELLGTAYGAPLPEPARREITDSLARLASARPAGTCPTL